MWLVINTYRVPLSRGMKGCHVYFVDKDTEIFFESRDFLISSDLLNNKEPQMNADFACSIRVYLRSSAVNRTD